MARYSVNKVVLLGNVGRDPEMRYTPGGQAVTNFSLATSRRRQDPNGEWVDETEWHRIVAWERLAEVANEGLRKGSKVYVEGRIQSRKYTDNQGVERTSYDIVVHDLTLIDRREQSAEGGERLKEGAKRDGARVRDEWAGGGGGASDDFDDVPF